MCKNSGCPNSCSFVFLILYNFSKLIFLVEENKNLIKNKTKNKTSLDARRSQVLALDGVVFIQLFLPRPSFIFASVFNLLLTLHLRQLFVHRGAQVHVFSNCHSWTRAQSISFDFRFNLLCSLLFLLNLSYTRFLFYYTYLKKQQFHSLFFSIHLPPLSSFVFFCIFAVPLCAYVCVCTCSAEDRIANDDTVKQIRFWKAKMTTHV